jgi:hypothetical protein
MIMLRDKRQVDVKTRRIVATGGAVGISLAATLVGLSLVLLSLRKIRLRVFLKKTE